MFSAAGESNCVFIWERDNSVTILLTMQGTLQSYVDDLLSEILCVSKDPPIIIKYLFDFLDTAAEDRRITDPDVLHTWKCNRLRRCFFTLNIFPHTKHLQQTTLIISGKNMQKNNLFIK